MKPSVFMGEPHYFRIVGGANPFTRNKWGVKKRVQKEKAIKQWHALAKLLVSLGVEVYVLPPQKEAPGLVYPANAGVCINDSLFILSNLIKSRKSEEAHYKKFIESMGLQTQTVSKPFEGEADLFPFQDKMVFTYGNIKKQHFTFKLGIPPWKRVYGFRSDISSQTELKKYFQQKEFVSLELINESYYHGDTALCSFGKKREHLLVYYNALSVTSCEELKKKYRSSLISLSEEDAKVYAANSFYFESEKGSYLVMPEGISSSLIKQVQSRGVEVILVNVSEFWKKGGGSVKCMIGTLPILPETKDPAVLEFRKSHLYSQMK